MALTDIENIRLKIGDQPTHQREAWTGDGTTSEVRLAVAPVLASPALRVYKNNVLLIETTDYTVDLSFGIVTLLVLPAIGDEFIFDYNATVYTDDEIQAIFDEVSSTTLASAYLLFAWAADAAKLAKKETLSGGGGFGTVVTDTSVRARELRESARAYIDQYQAFEGTSYAGDGLTEVAWTTQMAENWLVRELLRPTS